MNFSLSSKAIASSKADCLVVAVPEAGDWPESTRQADAALDGLITRLHKAGDITGKNASTTLVPLLDGQPWGRLLVVGTGKPGDRSAAHFRSTPATASTIAKPSDEMVGIENRGLRASFLLPWSVGCA